MTWSSWIRRYWRRCAGGIGAVVILLVLAVLGVGIYQEYEPSDAPALEAIFYLVFCLVVIMVLAVGKKKY